MSDTHADTLVAVAAELGRLGRRLDDLGGELLALRGDAAARPRDVPGPGAEESGGRPSAAPSGRPPEPPGQPAGPPGRLPAGGPTDPRGHAGGPDRPTPWVGPPAPQGFRPYPGPPPPVAPPRAPTPPPPRAPSRPSSLSGAKVLAWTGGAVTLLGVVLLLVLAASRGWFSPTARLVAGGVLGLGLIALAIRLHRKETSRTGAVAVAGTGVAALYLVVASATAGYGFLPVAAGLVLALVVAAGGLGLADRWRSQPLGVGALVGAALLVPVVTQGFVPELVVLVVVLQAAAAAVGIRREYSWLLVVAATFAVGYGSLTAVVAPRDQLWFIGAAAAGVLVVGCGAGLVATTRSIRAGLAVLAGAAVPMLVVAAQAGGVAGAVVAGGVAALMLGLALVRPLGRDARVVALAVGAVALHQATVQLLDGGDVVLAVLGEAVVFVVLAAVLRARVVLAVGAAYGVLGFLGALSQALPLRTLATFPAAPFARGATVVTSALVTGAAVALLLVALAVAVLATLRRTELLGSDGGRALLWVAAGGVGLYGAAGVVVALALLISPDRSGFVVGHAVVTVSWTLLALVLLARGIRSTPLRVAGIVLVGAALAKLVLFDLLSLDGIARVGAFLGAGLVLLTAGVRYARLVAEADREASRT